MNPDTYSILRRHFPAIEYALMCEVSDSTGSASQYADYIVMNLWRSRGLSLQGIELKSRRSDWLNELKRPAKAENIFKYCDYWWLLTEDESIAKLEEIPDSWGWMTIKGGRIFIKKKAPKLTPQPISRPFLASLLRRGCDKTGFILQNEIAETIALEKQNAVDSYIRDNGKYRDKYNDLYKEVDDFQTASGINLKNPRWDSSGKRLGEIVHFVSNGGEKSIRENLLELEETANHITEKISKAITLIKHKQELHPRYL